MADEVDNAINSFCPEPDTCQIRITGLNKYCYGCRKRRERIMSDYDDTSVMNRLTVRTEEVPCGRTHS